MPGYAHPRQIRIWRLDRQVAAEYERTESHQTNADHGRSVLAIAAPTVDDDIQARGVLIESSIVSRHGSSFSFVAGSRSVCRITVK